MRQDEGDEDRVRQDLGKAHPVGDVFPIAQDVEVGHQENEHLRDQDAEDDEDGILDPRPPVPEIDLREKVFGCQGAGKEHRADEHGFHEPVAQAGEDDRHQEDGENPVGYDQRPFHCHTKIA